MIMDLPFSSDDMTTILKLLKSFVCRSEHKFLGTYFTCGVQT